MSRDDLLTFDEPTHIYTYLPTGEHFTSVTTVIHRYFPHFDADLVLSKMRRKPLDAKYQGMTNDEIKKLWANNAKEASELGTTMHACIETFLKTGIDEWPTHLESEHQQFLAFYDTIKDDYEFYASELRIFDEDLKIAGSLDCLFRHKNTGKFMLLDWKRAKEFRMENKFEKAFPPIPHLHNCNYHQYSLQLCLYSHILREKYNIEVSEQYLVAFHQERSRYQKLRGMDYTTEIRSLLKDFTSK